MLTNTGHYSFLLLVLNKLILQPYYTLSNFTLERRMTKEKIINSSRIKLQLEVYQVRYLFLNINLREISFH